MKNKTKLFIISALSVCALSLGVTAVSASAETNAPTFTFGGTSLIIVVGVALETVKALEAQMLMRHYKGFLD